MGRYVATHENLGAYEVVRLSDQQRQLGVRIARRGATVLSIEMPVDGRLRQFADGYRDAVELEARPSSRFAIMAPFANRIADARYAYDGQEHDLQPGVTGTERASRHGFVRGVDFTLAEVHADDAGASAVFRSSAIRPETQPGYPYAIDLELRYSVRHDGLRLEAVMRNVGSDTAPCFFGWHPYFRIADSALDGWELSIPARQLVKVDAAAIPLPGAAAFAPVASEPEKDFRQRRPIGAVKLDQGYTDLIADPDGRVRSRLRDPISGLELALWQTHGVLLAFTADTVTRDVRRAIALEPMESLTNAFNRPDCAAAIALAPGAERRFVCGVEINQA
jgi:aldose 1-epimerase